MSLATFLFVLMLNNVKSDTVFTKNFNGNQKSLIYGRPNRLNSEKLSLLDLEENSNLDKLYFHYPQVEFLTKEASLESDYGDVDDGFTLIQSESTSHRDNRRFPRQKLPSQNVTVLYKPVRLSYVQKISKPKSIQNNEYSRYAEISTGSSELIEKTKKQDTINALLKNYLDKLYTKKYETTTISQESSEGSPETKLFPNKNIWKTQKKDKIDNIKKLFSLFTIVQFNNTECNATSDAVSYLGLCYTVAECTNLGGTSVGNCANGYGVCCVFRGTCGGSAAQNCSYFESPNYPDYYPAGGAVIIPSTIAPPITTANPSPTPDPRLYWSFFNNDDIARQSVDSALSCIFSVYKLNNSIKKMMISFLDLELAGPTNGTCTMERLVVTGQSSNSIVPPICGYNTGQSIYVDVSQSTGPLKLMILANMVYRKRFRIMICQYSDLCLPDNCLQIYDGVTGNISSFNYDQASMFNRSIPGYFNNLNYAICIRKAPGYCSITYTNVRNGIEYPFSLDNKITFSPIDYYKLSRNIYDGVSTVPLGFAGMDVVDCPNDYIVIGGATLCGYKFNDRSVTSNLSINAAVTDTSAGPIVIPVRTNAAAVGYGFRLFYTQNRC